MTSTPQVTGSARREASQQKLEQYIKEGYRIFIDTCSLLCEMAPSFWQNIIPYLEKYNSKVIIPNKCIEELYKHQDNTNNPELAKQANKSLGLIKKMLESGYVDIRGEQSDSFADNVFLAVFTKFRMNYKLLLITQDKKLAEDIIALNKSGAVYNINTIAAQQLNQYGFLSNIVWYKPEKESNGSSSGGYNPYRPDAAHNIPEDEIFLETKTLTSISSQPVKVFGVPGEGEVAYLVENGVQKPIRLEKEIGKGGEAKIYTTDTQYIAKIYAENNISLRKHEKIKLMLTKKINCPGVCYPIAPLYNSHKQFVGYIMPQAKGYQLQHSIFIKPNFLKYFPGWKKRDTVKLCVTILEKIKYLRERNILMGDINPANIMVVSPEEVYFVDTDSYQIEGFPCPMGTINYTAPEIQGNDEYETFLRTVGNENFAVATLLFMIMLPGKPPYSQQGGEDQATNIKKMDFSYPFGDSSNKKTPDGPWRFIWSHLTYDIKKAFFTTFRKGEEHSTEDTRLSVDEWLALFRYYLKLLESGKYGEQDEMSEELFPTRHKKNINLTYIKCSICGTDVPENNSQNGICRNCLNTVIERYKCARCGGDIEYTNYLKYIRRIKPYEVCHECFEWGSRYARTMRCIDCGEKFDITNGEEEYFRNKGLELPKRCPRCRAKR